MVNKNKFFIVTHKKILIIKLIAQINMHYKTFRIKMLDVQI